MAYSTNVLADSVNESGGRLTTLEVTFPRMVLAEFNTHRILSRNSASSRAIPVKKQLQRVKDDPFIPVHWGANQAGMQADAELSEADKNRALAEWLTARDSAVGHAERLLDIGLHKQIVNRILEPYMWHTVIVSGTEWRNFFALRANPQAQPEIRIAAELMQAAMSDSEPKLLGDNEWHLPLVQEDEQEWARENVDLAIKVSVGRCARVSYLTHDGVRSFDKDIELHDRLISSGHMSPAEHVATPGWKGDPEWSGNFYGWMQYRKSIRNEDDFSKVLEER